MAENINRVTITGNLTADPELRSTGSGTPVCSLRVAVNGLRKDQSGNWVDKPNYFNVVVWGAQGQNCANYLSKGRPVAVDGRLDWREWEAKDGSGKRSTIEIVADTVQFLGSRDGSAPAGGFNNGGQNQGGQAQNQGGGFTPASDVPTDSSDFASTGGGNAPDDDIPF
jgi:single-strand DNA-binding protein